MEAWISLKSIVLHQYQTFMNEFTTLGSFTQPRERETRLQFNEPEDLSTDGASQTEMIIQDGHLEVVRTGAIEMHQSFTVGHLTTGVYRTAHGQFETYAQTKKLDYAWDAKTEKGHLLFAYDFFIQNELAGMFDITLTFHTHQHAKEEVCEEKKEIDRLSD